MTMDDEKLKDIALNFQANINNELLNENMKFKKEIEALQTKPYFCEKCPYYEPDIMFDGKEEYDWGKCTYKTEPCEDAISRKAVLDACDQSINILDATDRIRELPSVNPIAKQTPESVNKDAKDKSIVTDDLISRNAVDEYISELLSGYLYDVEREKLEQFSAWLWDELPSVTPQIIRCKDCKHFKGKIVCEWHAGFYPDAEYFCSDAEAKMEEGE